MVRHPSSGCCALVGADSWPGTTFESVASLPLLCASPWLPVPTASSSRAPSSFRNFSISTRRSAAAAAAVKAPTQHKMPQQQSAHDGSHQPTSELTETDLSRLVRQRNVGISAHIDSGKTTLTERVLFYTGRIKDIHESAATYCSWKATPPTEKSSVSGDAADIESKDLMAKKEDFHINIIDTPGHVDFTIEVERALRVLDGAVLVLCAVSGVQSRPSPSTGRCADTRCLASASSTRWDRAGSNPWRVIGQIRNKLKMPAAAVQVPIGAEDDFIGLIDLIRWKAVYNEGHKGIEIRETDEIPAEYLELAKEKRRRAHRAARRSRRRDDRDLHRGARAHHRRARCCHPPHHHPMPVLARLPRLGHQKQGCPGHARRRVRLPAQPGPRCLLPAMDMSASATKKAAEEAAKAAGEDEEAAARGPQERCTTRAAALACFRGTAGRSRLQARGGQVRSAHLHARLPGHAQARQPHLQRTHGQEGQGTASGAHALERHGGRRRDWSRRDFAPCSPVISLAITPEGKESQNFSRALNRFQKEDPTFACTVDKSRTKPSFRAWASFISRFTSSACAASTTCRAPLASRVSLSARQSKRRPRSLTRTRSRRVVRVSSVVSMGYIEPMEVDPETGVDTAFENRVVGGSIPNGYIAACEKGFYDALEKGALSGHAVTGVRFVLEDGAAHSVDSSELAFRLATAGAFREAYQKANPVILEPKMTVEVVAPIEFQGAVIGALNQRKGTISDTEVREDEFTLTAEVSLNDMFGYSSQLRGLTQGKGEFSMEYKCPHARHDEHPEGDAGGLPARSRREEVAALPFLFLYDFDRQDWISPTPQLCMQFCRTGRPYEPRVSSTSCDSLEHR
ncbi:hypothetical protein L1887_57375 [Cichorium endivia]|nr:hypothetical protein L1887_57375 [Cichorium endivia]